MDFQADVLKHLLSIVESQSKLLESQSRLVKTIEAFEERLPVANRLSGQEVVCPADADDAISVGPKVYRAGSSVGETVSQQKDQSLTPRGDNSTWPANIGARYSADARDLNRGLVRSLHFRSLSEYHPPISAWFVIFPDSRLEMLLDVVSVIFVLWDLTITSFFLSWNIEYIGIFWVSVCISPPFWTLDLVRNFFMAFYQKGELETGKIAIAKSYLKSYFFLDLLVVIVDWAFLALLTTDHSNDESIAALQAMQIVKLTHIIQLFRMWSRLFARWDLYAERKFRKFDRLVASYLVIPTLYTLWGHHFLACLFYGVAKLGHHPRNWFQSLDGVHADDIPFLQSSLTNQYLAAYHFAMATVSLAGNFEAPVTNASERGVMIFTLVVGFVFGSVFISLISAALVDYQIKMYANSSRLRQLSKYLCENDVRMVVYQRVVKQAEQRLLSSDRLKEDDVDALTFLPKQLISDVRLEIQWPPLQHHSLFRLYQMLDEDVPRRLCNNALSYLDLSVGDELFKEGHLAESAYILTLGLLEYVQAPETSKVESLTRTAVDPGNWLSEAALFTIWFHVGLVHAKLSSRLLTIDAEAVTKVVLQSHPTVRAVAIEYGREFHRRTTLASPPNAWPNDLVVHSTDYCEVVLSLSLECQVEISKCAISTLSHTHSQALLNEVVGAKAVIILTGDGDLYRIKSIVALRVEDAEGKSFLVQIGKVKAACASPSIMLPGGTAEKGELVNDCLDRVLKTKLTFLDGEIDVVRTVCEVTESRSKDFSVQTRYYRSVVVCKHRGDKSVDLQVVNANTSTEASHREIRRPSVFEMNRVKSSSQGKELPMSALSFCAYVDWSGRDNGTIYAWLSEMEFDYLRSVAGTEWLRTWLNNCDFNPPVAWEL